MIYLLEDDDKMCIRDRYPTLEGGVTEIQKYGNIVLDIDPADLKDGGYTYGDLLTVTVNGTGYDMPLCTNYSDVDTGALVLRDSEGVLIAAINMGAVSYTHLSGTSGRGSPPGRAGYAHAGQIRQPGGRCGAELVQHASAPPLSRADSKSSGGRPAKEAPSIEAPARLLHVRSDRRPVRASRNARDSR